MKKEQLRPDLSIIDAWKPYADIAVASAGSFEIPIMTVRGATQSPRADELAFLVSGMHLEEPSGPELLSKPEPLLSLLQPYLHDGLSFLLIPQINMFGQQFVGHTSRSELLRCDHRGVEYNDGFGLNMKARITAESEAVERVMRAYLQTHRVTLGISLHEDSDLPKQGYIWTNGVPPLTRAEVRRSLDSKWGGSRYLFQSPQTHPSVPNLTQEGEFGHWEGPLAVDYADEGCLEHWWASMYGIAAFCVEAPHAAHPKIKELFLLDSLSIILRSIYKKREE